MEILKVNTPKTTENLSFEVRRADPEVEAKEMLVFGALGLNQNLEKEGAYAGFSPVKFNSNIVGWIQANLKCLNGCDLREIKISGTGAKKFITSGSLDFAHQDNTLKQNKISMSRFADEYKYLDTLITIPVEYALNQNNGIIFDISGLAKDETLKIDLILKNFADYHAE